MKKVLLYSFLATTIIFSNTIMVSAKPCPIHSECKNLNTNQKHTTHYSPCRFIPEEQKKIIETRKEEFKKRLNITEEQRTELEKIKAHEQKVLMPYKKKIEKEEDKLKDLFLKEHEIRVKHSQQFEALLTPEQKAELQKFKAETIKEMMKFAPPANMFKAEEPTTKTENEIETQQTTEKKQPETNSSELNCTCKQEKVKENEVEIKNTEVQNEPIPEVKTENENRKELKIKGTSENALKEASTEDFNENEKKISKFVKENTADEKVEAVTPNEELQPKALERKVIEPTIAPTPTAPTIQEEITLEK